MKIDRNWVTATILAIPLAWVIAFLLFLRPIIPLDFTNILVLSLSLIFGLILGGILADKLRKHSLILVLNEMLILAIGIVQWIFPLSFWQTFTGLLFLAVLIFLLGYVLVLLTIFLNQLVSSVHRGHIVGIVTVITVLLAAFFSIFWQFPVSTSFVPAMTAGLILLILIITFLVRPWKEELQIYMVPGFIRHYAIWWGIYLAAYGLYVWATPVDLRFIYVSLFSNLMPFPTELILVGLSGAIFVFAFLPDKLGRKLVFNIATLLLGLLCIFGGAQLDETIGVIVSLVLTILEAFVIAFIIGVGAWLVWAEIGAVRKKGRRAAFGWMLVGILGTILWVITILPSQAELSLLVYPIAASLVLISIFPLTNAREVVWNERVIEDIDISVDSRQVSRAIRDLEVDTSLKSIKEQKEAEVTELMKIQGLSKKQAKDLRDFGYETPELITRADAETLAQALSISTKKAQQIIDNARAMKKQTRKLGTKPSKTRTTK
ncbi:MAG: helix-hairpin-helix domain-containing protein [Promethearchaeota archaeon]